MIAVLGATGYVGVSLSRLLAQQGAALVLFGRDAAKLADIGWPSNVELRAVDAFRAAEFDLVINAIGAGDPERVSAMGAGILDLTRFWDDLVLTTMGPRARYVFLSSGVVHDARLEGPGDVPGEAAVPADRFESVPPYTLSKLQAEARHRRAAERAILDIRVFGYADAAIRTEGTFFLAQLTRSLAERSVFVTSPDDMVRDYAGASELLALIRCWENAQAPNCALDLYTRAPVGKLALLDVVSRRFGLEIRHSAAVTSSPTGRKAVYASTSRAAADIGYRPERDAMQVVLAMLDARLAKP